MPGFEIDALNGRSFVKGMLELEPAADPVRGPRAAPASTAAGSGRRSSPRHSSPIRTRRRDKVEAFNVGLQFDLQLHVLNRLPMMLSLGYARGFEGDGKGEDEFMLSLKVL